MGTNEFKMRDGPFILPQGILVRDGTSLVADEVPYAHLIHFQRAAFIAVDYRHPGDWFPKPRLAECMGKLLVEARSERSTLQ